MDWQICVLDDDPIFEEVCYGLIHWCLILQHEEVLRGGYDPEIITENQKITTNHYITDAN